jgi:hypothetical protein
MSNVFSLHPLKRPICDEKPGKRLAKKSDRLDLMHQTLE